MVEIDECRHFNNLLWPTSYAFCRLKRIDGFLYYMHYFSFLPFTFFSSVYVLSVLTQTWILQERESLQRKIPERKSMFKFNPSLNVNDARAHTRTHTYKTPHAHACTHTHLLNPNIHSEYFAIRNKLYYWMISIFFVCVLRNGYYVLNIDC